jgi:large subunit ribosomal protein L30e
MDFETSLRRAIKSGNVLFGQNSTQEAVEGEKAQMVVVAENCPGNFNQFMQEHENVFSYTYKGSSMQLGKACGKPFMVSALAIVDAGESDILNFKRA